MIHHTVDHHLSEIPIGKIGIVPIYSIAHCHAFLDGLKQTVACPINLKGNKTLHYEKTIKATTKIDKK